jgi:hypothetical protein
MPDAYLERERVGIMHATQLLHEVDHVPHGLLRQLPYAHEPAGAGLGESGHGTGLDSVKVTQGRPPFPSQLRGAGQSLVIRAAGVVTRTFLAAKPTVTEAPGRG